MFCIKLNFINVLHAVHGISRLQLDKLALMV
jgi:hypothetical protein